MELGDDATYPITGERFVSFCMPSYDVVELDNVLYVPHLSKNLFLVSIMIDLRCVIEFDDQ